VEKRENQRKQANGKAGKADKPSQMPFGPFQQLSVGLCFPRVFLTKSRSRGFTGVYSYLWQFAIANTSCFRPYLVVDFNSPLHYNIVKLSLG
jgi:hypothetical protein